MGNYLDPHRRPLVQPPCVGCAHVDAAMAHGLPKVVVPVRGVKGIVFIKVGDVLDVSNQIARASHVLGGYSGIDREFAQWGRGLICASRHTHVEERRLTCVCDERLLRDVDFDPLV